MVSAQLVLGKSNTVNPYYYERSALHSIAHHHYSAAYRGLVVVLQGAISSL